jgi:hypothetical protein
VNAFELADPGEPVEEIMSFTMHPRNLRVKLTPRR